MAKSDKWRYIYGWKADIMPDPIMWSLCHLVIMLLSEIIHLKFWVSIKPEIFLPFVRIYLEIAIRDECLIKKWYKGVPSFQRDNALTIWCYAVCNHMSFLLPKWWFTCMHLAKSWYPLQRKGRTGLCSMTYRDVCILLSVRIWLRWYTSKIQFFFCHNY